MERLNYQEIVQKILSSHAKNRLNSQTEVKLLFDTERDRASSYEYWLAREDREYLVVLFT